MRVETLAHALAFAIVEFTTARNTRTQKRPNEARATPSHDAAPSAPNVANLPGPKYTDIAYVVRT